VTLELKPEVEALINKCVESGAFATPEDVVERALELLSAEEDWLANNRDQIAADIQDGWEAAQRGELIDDDQVRLRMDPKKQEWISTSSPKS
jgi:antitoxin ParD1/3/4